MIALTQFPLTPTMRARLNARDDAVTYARAILRSEAPHASDDVRLACRTLMTYGNEWDWLDAYHRLRALDAPPVQFQPVPVDRPDYSAGTGTIRRVLVGTAAMVAAAWIGLVGVLVW